MATKKISKKQSAAPSNDAQQQLPGLSEFMRAMPNHLARSSLFAPVARGKRKMLENHLLVTRADAEIRFWGPQLDEAHADVWMHAMHEASRVPLGTDVVVTRSQFLRAIGRDTGKWQYDWLRRAMLALQRSVIVVTVRRPDGTTRGRLGSCVEDALSLISGFRHDEDRDEYVLTVDKRWRHLYGGQQYALIDWQKRLEFRPQQDMAKSLQRLIATSDEPVQRYALAWLQERLCFTGVVKDFRRSLRAALAELERLAIVADARIEKSTRGVEQAVWTRL